MSTETGYLCSTALQAVQFHVTLNNVLIRQELLASTLQLTIESLGLTSARGDIITAVQKTLDVDFYMYLDVPHIMLNAFINVQDVSIINAAFAKLWAGCEYITWTAWPF